MKCSRLWIGWGNGLHCQIMIKQKSAEFAEKIILIGKLLQATSGPRVICVPGGPGDWRRGNTAFQSNILI